MPTLAAASEGALSRCSVGAHHAPDGELGHLPPLGLRRLLRKVLSLLQRPQVMHLVRVRVGVRVRIRVRVRVRIRVRARVRARATRALPRGRTTPAPT